MTRDLEPLPFVFDAHVDSLQLALELEADLGVESPGQLDLPRARRAGLGAIVFASWVDPRFIPMARGGAQSRANRLIDCLESLCSRHANQVQLVRTAADLESARSSGRLAAFAGMEGAHPLEREPGAGDWMTGLEHFHRRGLRVLTLVWNNHLPWIRSCEPDPAGVSPEGLSELGQHLVARLNELGIVIDLSHAGPRSFYDALESSTHPVMVSHSGCRALQDHQRNLDDDQLQALAKNGGVIGMPFLPSFLDRGAQERAAQVRATDGYRSLRGENSAALELARTAFMRTSVEPLAIERLVDHVVHVAELIGVEHVGLGSDFDGIATTVAGLEDCAGYQCLVEPLLARGFDDREVELVLGGNWLRVFESVLPRT